jgi:S1-C subfamily serine protease
MNRLRLAAVALTAVSLVLSATRAATEAEAAAGRALVKRYADAIVGVEMVVMLKVKQGDREGTNERRVDVNGTVISPDGLTVTSLAAVDPQSAFEALRAAGQRVELVGADFKEVKLRLADGTEVPARFVLKDSDLDLAFMAPDTSADATKREFPFVDLNQSTTAEIYGTYYYVARAPKTLQRIPLSRLTTVLGVIEKPRRYYLMTDLGIGTPIFDAQGKTLGVALQYFANSRPAAVAVLPAGDIAEMAKQAAAAQAAPESK